MEPRGKTPLFETTGMLQIQCAQVWQKVEVYDFLGRMLFTQTQATQNLDLSKLPAGMYVVKVYFEVGDVVQRETKE